MWRWSSEPFSHGAAIMISSPVSFSSAPWYRPVSLRKAGRSTTKNARKMLGRTERAMTEIIRKADKIVITVEDGPMGDNFTLTIGRGG